MVVTFPYREAATLELSWGEVTGAIGDSATVLPIVVALGVVTDLSLGAMLLWFGVFQVVWGVYYGLPVSVEPMKALAALLLAGTLTTGEFVVAGLLAGIALLLAGSAGLVGKIERYVGEPVVRGVQLAVALVLLETGIELGWSDPILAVAGLAVAALAFAVGRPRVSALAVLGLGGLLAVVHAGALSLTLPSLAPPPVSTADLTSTAAEATLAQLAMTVGNAAVATSLLLSDFFDRDISGDELSKSMGGMTLLALPLGGLPMCHGSGGVAGKYAFGARTAGANLVLGAGYVLVAVTAVGVVAAFPVAALGVVLALVAVELGRAALRGSTAPLVFLIGGLGVLVNLGVAFVVGVAVHLLAAWWRRE